MARRAAPVHHFRRTDHDDINEVYAQRLTK